MRYFFILLSLLMGAAYGETIPVKIDNDGTITNETVSVSLIGNMTQGNGLAGAFDSNTGTHARKEVTSGWTGATLTEPMPVKNVEVSPNTLGFDASGLTTPITLYLRAKNGAAPSSPTDGVLLGSISFTDVNSITPRTITSNDTATEYTHVWVYGTTGVWTLYTEVLYTLMGQPEGPPPSQGQIAAGLSVTEFFYETHTPLATALSLTNGSCSGQGNCNILPRQIVKVNIGPVQVGDVVEYDGEFEVTNDQNYVVSVVSNIDLTTDPDFGNDSDALFTETFNRASTSQAYIIGKHNGPNLDRSIIHHDPHLRSGFIMISPQMATALGTGDCYLVFWAWSVSTAAQAGHSVAIAGPGYTKLVALKRRYAP